MEDIKEQVTRILLNQGWKKKVISMPGEVHFTKSINAFMLIEVVITSNPIDYFLSISIYNTTGIGKERITQKYTQNFSKRHIQSFVMRLDSVIPMMIEDMVVKFIRSILQKK